MDLLKRVRSLWSESTRPGSFGTGNDLPTQAQQLVAVRVLYRPS